MLTSTDAPVTLAAPAAPLPPVLAHTLPKAVARNRWFASLSASHQAALLKVSRRWVLRDDQLVMTQGQSVRKRRDGLMVLVDGSLKIASTSAAGSEAILSFVQPGQWFGELALIDGLPRARDVRSVGVSEVLVVEPDAFAALMQDSSFAAQVTQLLSSRTRMLMGLVEDFAMRSARARAARRLLLLACDDDPYCKPTRKEIHVSHEALASMLGMTRQTLAQQLKLLSQAGAIAQGYSRIVVTSIVVLMAEASGT
jgi:CRP/FNR family transcriptional regulator, cyclic AMP receptor protein